MSATATLELTTLKCVRRQDLEGSDEPRIKVNGKDEWDSVMAKGDSKSVNITVDFVDFATVTLDEMNGNRAKQIGSTVEIPADRPETRTVDFKTSGAHYQLTYTVVSSTVATSVV
jgi:hypothetical protein